MHGRGPRCPLRADSAAYTYIITMARPLHFFPMQDVAEHDGYYYRVYYDLTVTEHICMAVQVDQSYQTFMATPMHAYIATSRLDRTMAMADAPRARLYSCPLLIARRENI
jgi:hypothetical protein